MVSFNKTVSSPPELKVELEVSFTVTHRKKAHSYTLGSPQAFIHLQGLKQSIYSEVHSGRGRKKLHFFFFLKSKSNNKEDGLFPQSRSGGLLCADH